MTTITKSLFFIIKESSFPPGHPGVFGSKSPATFIRHPLPTTTKSSLKIHRHPAYFAAIFAHESFSVTVRLNTGFPSDDSFGSTKKYPKRSNWNRWPGSASASAGSM